MNNKEFDQLLFCRDFAEEILNEQDSIVYRSNYNASDKVISSEPMEIISL